MPFLPPNQERQSTEADDISPYHSAFYRHQEIAIVHLFTSERQIKEAMNDE